MKFTSLVAFVLGWCSMPTDIHLDLADARSLLERSGTEDEKRKYRKAAEIILLKAINLEPESKEAKALLQSARALSATDPVAEPVLFKSLQPEKKNKPRMKLPIGITAAILVGGGVLWLLQSRLHEPATLAAPIARPERINQSDFQPLVGETQGSAPPAATEALPPAPAEQPVSEPVSAPVSAPVTVPVSAPVSARVTVPVSAPVSAPPTPAANVAPPRKTISPPRVAETPQSAPTVAMGELAVNSPIAAEIYQNGQYLGSTPTTLQLPAGQQTLEYRHGELRSTGSYDIKPNERTAASVTFQITVQINVRPWAQVFLEGAPRRPLGQTPLSGVSVPVGGMLVFENPNFTEKKYRITEKDSAIQLNFP